MNRNLLHEIRVCYSTLFITLKYRRPTVGNNLMNIFLGCTNTIWQVNEKAHKCNQCKRYSSTLLSAQLFKITRCSLSLPASTWLCSSVCHVNQRKWADLKACHLVSWLTTTKCALWVLSRIMHPQFTSHWDSRTCLREHFHKFKLLFILTKLPQHWHFYVLEWNNTPYG